MNYYSVYNLTIASEIPIRALTNIQPPAAPESIFDVTVTLGKTPDNLSRPPLVENVCASMAENEFLFYHEKLGIRIFVKDGREVIVDKAYYTNPDMVSIYFLGSIMGAVLYMRDCIPLHASAVMTDKGAILFTGTSGAGKSTIAHALQLRGYMPITDDVVPLQVVDNRVCVYSGYNTFKLWEQSLTLNRLESTHCPRIRDSFNKYYIKFSNEPGNRPYPVHKIYQITTHNRDEQLSINQTDSKLKLKILKNNIYRKTYVAGLNKQRPHFQVIVKMAHIPMSTIIRPNIPASFDDYVESIEKDMLS